MQKRGQLTVFIVIGIIVVSAFAFLFYTQYSVIRTRSQYQTKTVSESELEVSSLKYYITSCLDSAIEEGVNKISMQGGFIFKGEPGSIMDYKVPYVPFNYSGSEYNVSFQIYAPDRSIVDQAPYYPCYISFPGSRMPPTWSGLYCLEHYNHTQGYFDFGNTGDPVKHILPEVCMRSNFSTARYSCSCVSCKYTMEEQLMSYIAYETRKCINRTLFKDYGEVTVGKVEANITFGLEDLSVLLTYPVKIKSASETEMLVFYKQVDVPLKRVYEDIARAAIAEDIKKVDYDIAKGIYTLANKYKMRNISVERQVIGNGSASVIIITDARKQFYSKNYTFMFAVQNRAPAIDYYDTSGGLENILVSAGEKITIRPVIYDPDENGLVVNYTGWMADYKDVIKPNGETVKQDLGGNNMWEHSAEYTYGDYCIMADGKKSHICGSIQTTAGDIGVHYTNIAAYDYEGIYDSQTLKIVVESVPKVILKFIHAYTDLPHEINASTEDPVTLDASATKATFGSGVMRFQWQDTAEPELFPAGYIEDSVIKLGETADINTIKDETFTTSGGHILHLDVKTETGKVYESTFDIKVSDCMPYESEVPPYPFNDLSWMPVSKRSSNDFMGDHACCEYQGDKGVLKGDGEECFTQTDYGNSDQLNGKVYPYVSETVPSSADYFVYKRTITALCDETRGNKCGTEPADTRIEISAIPLDCGKCYVANYTLLGQGEGELDILNPDAATRARLCVLRPITDTTPCNQVYECSSGNGGPYPYPMGTVKCLGVCNGAGECRRAYHCQDDYPSDGCPESS